jgi:hypothetical protein
MRALAILTRCDSYEAYKRAPHSISARKTAGGSDLFEATICSLDLVTSRFDSRL